MVIVSNSVLILKIYATLPIWLFMLILNGFDRFKHNSYGFNDNGVY